MACTQELGLEQLQRQIRIVSKASGPLIEASPASVVRSCAETGRESAARQHTTTVRSVTGPTTDDDDIVVEIAKQN